VNLFLCLAGSKSVFPVDMNFDASPLLSLAQTQNIGDIERQDNAIIRQRKITQNCFRFLIQARF